MCGKTDLQTLDLANYKKVLAMISQESVSELSSKEP